MEFWPGDLVVFYEATTSVRINMQAEVPVLEHLLLASSNPAAQPLADRLAEAEVVHNRSRQPDTQLSIDSAEAQAICDAVDATRDDPNSNDLDDFPGLLHLRDTLSTVEY